MRPDGRRGGRGWAYAGAVLGGAVSVAANVAHSYVPPPGASPGWSPLPGAVVGAVFWPLALFVAIEILARTAWPEGAAWKVVRLGGLLPVAVVAAVVSYRHLSGLIRYYGEDGLTATVGPLAVDGLMIVASAAIVASAPASGAGRAPAVAAPDATVSPEPPPRVAPAAPSPARPRAEEVAKPASTGAAGRQRREAREYVLAELRAGRTPTGAAVGRRFGRNSRWGQRLVRDALAASPAPADPPAEPAGPPAGQHLVSRIHPSSPDSPQLEDQH